METYSTWEAVPEHLKTRTALKQLGLKPKRGQKPAAVKTHWHWKTPDYDLYDMRECVANVVSEKQKAALEKAKAASLEKRTCTRCGWVEELNAHYRGKWYVRNGLCPACREQIEHENNRAEAIEWAQRMLATEGVLILDTETTDLYGEIIELAIINLKGETVYNSRFKPTEAISPGAYDKHGISMDDLMDAPLFKDELPPNIAGVLLTAPTVLIYNAAFDVARIGYTCRLYGFGDFNFKHDCLMLWYAQYVNDWSSYHESYRWQPLWGEHSALGDCRAALGVLKEMANADESYQDSGHAGDGGAAGDGDPAALSGGA